MKTDSSENNTRQQKREERLKLYHHGICSCMIKLEVCTINFLRGVIKIDIILHDMQISRVIVSMKN